MKAIGLEPDVALLYFFIFFEATSFFVIVFVVHLFSNLI